MSASSAVSARERLVGRGALLASAIGLAGCGVAVALDADAAARAWLFGFHLWLGPALGCVAIAALHLLTGGAWGRAARPALSAGLATLPLFALLFVPVGLGLARTFAWAAPARAVASPADRAWFEHVEPYLNPAFFLIRAAAFLALWSWLAFALRRAPDQRAGAEPRRAAAPKLGAAGLVLYFLTVTFASIDWAMSLDPRWFSAVYGARWAVGQALGAVCVVLILAAWTPAGARVSPERLRDLANLLLALVMLWAYLALSQFLVIWSGDLPEEVVWYARRATGPWPAVAAALALFHLAAPLAILLSRRAKEAPRMMGTLALALLGARVLELAWLLVPSFTTAPPAWATAAACVAIGGAWVALLLALLAAERRASGAAFGAEGAS